jgi:hypothetical protein
MREDNSTATTRLQNATTALTALTTLGFLATRSTAEARASRHLATVRNLTPVAYLRPASWLGRVVGQCGIEVRHLALEDVADPGAVARMTGTRDMAGPVRASPSPALSPRA